VIFEDGPPWHVEDVQGGWHVSCWIELRRGVPVITELQLRSAEGTTLEAAHGGDWNPQETYQFEENRKVPTGGITKDVLKGVSTTALYDAIGKDDESAFSLVVHGFQPDEDLLAIRRPGRKGHGDYYYALWAHRYVEACTTTRQPFKELAAAHGYRESTLRNVVGEAVTRGLLVRGKKGGAAPGSAGGRLTKKGEKVLVEQRPVSLALIPGKPRKNTAKERGATQ